MLDVKANSASKTQLSGPIFGFTKNSAFCANFWFFDQKLCAQTTRPVLESTAAEPLLPKLLQRRARPSIACPSMAGLWRHTMPQQPGPMRVRQVSCTRSQGGGEGGGALRLLQILVKPRKTAQQYTSLKGEGGLLSLVNLPTHLYHLML